MLRRGGSARELKIVVGLVVSGLISIFDIRGETRLLRSTLSRALAFKGGDHVDGSRLAFLSRRARRGRGLALLGALLGPALGILLDRLELTALVEALLSSWRHGDRCVRRRQPRSLLVTPIEAPITHLVLRSLGLELFATRRTIFGHELLDHIDGCSVVTKMLASRVRRGMVRRRYSRVKAMTIDNRLQHFSNSEGAVVVLFVEACSPLTPLMVAGVVDIKNKLKSSQGFRIETPDANLEIVPGRLDGARPLQRVLHVLAKRRANHDKRL